LNLNPDIDPLEAASDLLELISRDEGEACEVIRLAFCMDKFIYALGFLINSENIGYIESTDENPPETNYDQMRRIVGRNFPMLGLYWTALHSSIAKDAKGELACGDAIDDLTDIASELEQVSWFRNNFGRQEGLTALRFRYESHLYMHLLPLRAHLEELIHT
jgi:hypothetical protein